MKHSLFFEAAIVMVLAAVCMGCTSKSLSGNTQEVNDSIVDAKVEEKLNETVSLEQVDEMKSEADVKEIVEEAKQEEPTKIEPSKDVVKNAQQPGLKCSLRGEISTIENVQLVLRGNTGTLKYVMDGKRIVSNLQVDYTASKIDKDGLGYLVLKSFAPNGKLKGRFIGEMDIAECGYLYKGNFVNVNGDSTTFFLTEV